MKDFTLTYQPEKNKFFSKRDVEKVWKLRKMVVDYFTFGMIEPGRNENATAYRYAFDGFEADNEVAGKTYCAKVTVPLYRWFL